MIDYEKLKSEILNSESLESLPSEFRPPVPKCAADENYVFISYSHRDYKAVYCDLLEFHKKGVRYWYDYGLPAGEDWDKFVESKIKGAGCAGVVFYLSENLFLSRSVNKEIEFTYGDGETDGKKYFCVNLSGAQPTKIMKQIIRKYDDDELEKFGIDDRMVGLLQAFSDRSTYMSKTSDSDISHITETVAQMVRQFNIVATGIEVEENEAVQKLQDELDVAKNFAIKDGVLVKYIGTDEKVVIPGRVTAIGEVAFEKCDFIKEVIIPDSVTGIDYEAFWNCSSLTSITIPYSVTSIGDSAFRNCSSLTSITIPDSVTSIGGSAFCNCSSLTSITIGDSVTSIGGSVFAYCSNLTSITIPDSVTSIADSAFSSCSSLESITVADGNSVYHSAGNCLIKTASRTLIAGCKNSIIPTDGSVTSIGDSAFYDCSSLTSITIPDSVTSIGDSAFTHCSSLESITVEDGNSVYHSAGNCLIETASRTLIAGCKNSIIPTDGSATSIGDSAFDGCSNLTSITIPDSVTSIGDSAFFSCSSLTDIHYLGTIAEWNTIEKGLFWDFDTPTYTVHCTDGDIVKE